MEPLRHLVVAALSLLPVAALAHGPTGASLGALALVGLAALVHVGAASLPGGTRGRAALDLAVALPCLAVTGALDLQAGAGWPAIALRGAAAVAAVGLLGAAGADLGASRERAVHLVCVTLFVLAGPGLALALELGGARTAPPAWLALVSATSPLGFAWSELDLERPAQPAAALASLLGPVLVLAAVRLVRARGAAR